MGDRRGRGGEEARRREKEEEKEEEKEKKERKKVGGAHSGNEAFLRECRHIIPPSDWPLKSSARGKFSKLELCTCIYVQGHNMCVHA